MLADELPRSAPDRRVAEVLPVERARLDRAAPERRQHAAPLERQRVASRISRRVRHLSRFEDGRNDVGELERRMEDARLDPAVRPVNDQRRRDAALVHPSLVEPERRVRQVRPRPSVAAVGVVRTGLDVGRVADAQRCTGPGRWGYDAAPTAESFGIRDRQALGARAVVRQEEEKRVRQRAGLGERRDDASDAAIHPVDLSGIRLHADELPGMVRRVPPGRLGGVPAAQGRPGRHDPFGHEAFESGFA